MLVWRALVSTFNTVSLCHESLQASCHADERSLLICGLLTCCHGYVLRCCHADMLTRCHVGVRCHAVTYVSYDICEHMCYANV